MADTLQNTVGSDFLSDVIAKVEPTQTVDLWDVVISNDQTPGLVGNPGIANAERFVGVAMTGGADGATINVRRSGYAYVIASGTITAGDELNIASTGGDVKKISETSSIVNVIGIAAEGASSGNAFLMRISPYQKWVP